MIISAGDYDKVRDANELNEVQKWRNISRGDAIIASLIGLLW